MDTILIYIFYCYTVRDVVLCILYFILFEYMFRQYKSRKDIKESIYPPAYECLYKNNRTPVTHPKQ